MIREKQMQLDFGQYRLRSGLKLFIFASVLSASRYKYVIFQAHPFRTDEANESVVTWLKRRANGKISQATKQIPALLIEHERESLRPVRNSIFRKDSLIGREERNVNEKACISVDACGYQLPSKYRNKTVEIYVTKQKLFVFDLYTGEEIVDYELSPIPGKIICKREHRRETEKTARELKALVSDMFGGENWKRFTETNFKAFIYH